MCIQLFIMYGKLKENKLNKLAVTALAVLMLALGNVPGLAQTPTTTLADNVPALLVQANQAYSAEDYPLLRSTLQRLHQMRPYNSEYMYRLVLAYALLDQKRLAYDLMLRMQQQGLAYDFTLSDDSKNIRGTEVFDYVNDLMKLAAEPMGEVETMFTLPADVVMPETITWDESRQKFLVGTAAEGQVLAVDMQGEVEELIRADNENGMWAVLDILVDGARNRLWVSSAAIPAFRNFSTPDQGRSALFEFELETLELLRRYPVPVDGRPHVLGNMIMNADGDIFIADRALPIIYSKPAGEQKLKAVFASQEMVSLRGIALQPDGRIMYIADREMGITVVDFAQKKAAQLTGPETLNLGGIAGMYLWNNNLVIIQNGISPQRVFRLGLDASGTRIEAVRPLAVAQPEFDFPSFGVLKGEDLVYFASSHFTDETGQNKPVTVLRTGVDSNEDLLSAEMLLYLEKEKQAEAQKKEEGKE